MTLVIERVHGLIHCHEKKGEINASESVSMMRRGKDYRKVTIAETREYWSNRGEGSRSRQSTSAIA